MELIERRALEEIGSLGCLRAIYLTDDPWSPTQKAKWFISALPEYDFVFTTRRANLADLKGLGVRRVSYLPFAWDPVLCPDSPMEHYESGYDPAEIVFAGGADSERVPYIEALAKAGFSIALYGTYWDRFRAYAKADARSIVRIRTPASDCSCLYRSLFGAASEPRWPFDEDLRNGGFGRLHPGRRHA